MLTGNPVIWTYRKINRKEQEVKGGGSFKQDSTWRRVNGFFAAVTIKHLQSQKFQNIGLLSSNNRGLLWSSMWNDASDLCWVLVEKACDALCFVLIDIDLVETSGTMQRSYFSYFYCLHQSLCIRDNELRPSITSFVFLRWVWAFIWTKVNRWQLSSCLEIWTVYHVLFVPFLAQIIFCS